MAGWLGGMAGWLGGQNGLLGGLAGWLGGLVGGMVATQKPLICTLFWFLDLYALINTLFLIVNGHVYSPPFIFCQPKDYLELQKPLKYLK